jgi:hypothetical protein
MMPAFHFTPQRPWLFRYYNCRSYLSLDLGKFYFYWYKLHV